MIYMLHEMQLAASAPLRAWAKTSHKLFSNPLSPWSYLPGSNRIAAGSELLARFVKRYEKPEWGIETAVVDGNEVPLRIETVATRPFCHLLHFKRYLRRKDPPVLLVAPMSGHHATLLRDTVRALIRDHDVFVTDWIDARQVPLSQGPFHLDTYIEYVMDFIRIIGPETHVAAVCQPTVPTLAAVSLMAANGETVQARSLILFGGPIDTRRSPTAPNLYAKSHSLRWFESNVIDRVPLRYPGYLRRVYPGFLQHSGFVAMNPDRHLQAHLDFYQHLVRGDGESAEAHRRFYDEYNAVMDMPAEYYLETIERVFQKHELPLGVMKYRGQVVEPAAIRETALLTIEGELDDISGPGQTQAAHDLCAGIPIDKKQDFVVPGVGHYGIFSGRRWREQICPHVRDFIRANS